MPLDPEISAFLAQTASWGAPSVEKLTPAEARAATESAAAGLFGAADPVGAVVDRALPGPNGPVRVRIYEPETAERPLPVLVWFHGGGWVVGSLDTHDGVCRGLAARTPCIAVSVDYRLAPEHRFPAAVDDAWAALAWVAEHAASLGGDPARLAVGGDSAGGTLATVCARRARDRGLPLALQLLVYPVCDCDFDRPSYVELAEGYWLTREAMRWYFGHYLGAEADPTDPEVSPLRAGDLSGLADAVVLTAEFDPLRDEAEEYAERLRQAGVRVAARRYDGMIHGFYRMGAVTRRTHEALDESARALATAFAARTG